MCSHFEQTSIYLFIQVYKFFNIKLRIHYLHCIKTTAIFYLIFIHIIYVTAATISFSCSKLKKNIQAEIQNFLQMVCIIL